VILVGDSHLAVYIDYNKYPIYTQIMDPARVILINSNKFIYINDYEIMEMQVYPM
jgi:hypothetical protein